MLHRVFYDGKPPHPSNDNSIQKYFYADEIYLSSNLLYKKERKKT